jgi:hypothetical protein
MAGCTDGIAISGLVEIPTADPTDLILIQRGTVYRKMNFSSIIATQAEVDTGTATNVFVTPDTLKNTPKVDLGAFDFGMLLVDAQPATNETFTIEVDGVTVIFEFTVGGGVTVGDVEVVKGASTALTAAAWITAINSSVLSMSAIVNPVTANLINWITDNANEAVTLTDGTTGDILFNQAGGERAPLNTIPIYREYTVTADDITAGAIMIRTPVSSFPDGVLIQVLDSAGFVNDTANPQVDTFTVTNGNINITTNSVIVAGSIIIIIGNGVI